jgi:hypothetical protein
VHALADTVRLFGKQPSYSVSFGEIPEPDPRLPRLPIAYTVWTYEGTVARPAFEKESSSVAEEIAEVAGSEYDLEAWASEASALGRSLSSKSIRAVLRAMVHLPACPDDVLPWDWRFRVQLAAALTVAGIEAKADREAALLSLLHGPVDWTTTAGAIALVEIAAREQGRRDEIVSLLLDELVVPRSPIRFQCVVEPLVPLLLARVPLAAETAQTLREYRERFAF